MDIYTRGSPQDTLKKWANTTENLTTLDSVKMVDRVFVENRYRGADSLTLVENNPTVAQNILRLIHFSPGQPVWVWR